MRMGTPWWKADAIWFGVPVKGPTLAVDSARGVHDPSLRWKTWKSLPAELTRQTCSPPSPNEQATLVTTPGSPVCRSTSAKPSSSAAQVTQRRRYRGSDGWGSGHWTA